MTGAAADGSDLLLSAQDLLESARREGERNPEAAYVLAHDAARIDTAALVLDAAQKLQPQLELYH